MRHRKNSMSSTTVQVISEKARSNILSLRWIISGREDMVWFIGSVASSYALFALYVSGLLPLVPMVAAWAILIDAPHVFATFSRTYFDRTERRARRRLLLGSLVFFFVGPVMILAGAGLVFFFLAALWAYYHLVKQHYGFMVLYNKKYTSSTDCRERYGAAELISRRLLYYIAFGILFGLWYQLPRQFVGRATDPTTLPVAAQLLSAFFWGYAFIHYYLDSKIWRVRRDPSVGKALQMD